MKYALIVFVSAILNISATKVVADDTGRAPSYVECLKAIQPLETFSREWLRISCLSVTEKYCMASIRETAPCFEVASLALQKFNSQAEPLIPDAPSGLSPFRQKSYTRALKRIREDPQPVDNCTGTAVACAIIALLPEVMITDEVFRLAKIADIPLQ